MTLGCIGYTIPYLNEGYYTGPVSIDLYNYFDGLIRDYNIDKFICGLNIGVDVIFSWVAIMNNIPLDVYIPYNNWTKGWTQKDLSFYNETLEYKNGAVIVAAEPNWQPWKEKFRNKRIVQDCDILIGIDRDERVYDAVRLARILNKDILETTFDSVSRNNTKAIKTI